MLILVGDETDAPDFARSIARLSAVALADSTRPDRRRQRARQAALLREIFGNPFRPVVIDPLWLSANDSAALDLARMIDETGNFHAMPILADALEEAGCADSDVLWHCRHGNNHVRGCWLLDVLLGKA